MNDRKKETIKNNGKTENHENPKNKSPKKKKKRKKINNTKTQRNLRIEKNFGENTTD